MPSWSCNDTERRALVTTSIESVTFGAVGLALEAATLRHQAIASNIANANTPGYQPLRVSFEEQLGALRASLGGSGTSDLQSLAAVQPRLERDAAASPLDGASGVAIDDEVARLSANVVHYQALLRALGRQLSILNSAVNDGKR
jgi:flagellar basal-body rod protein FlgB